MKRSVVVGVLSVGLALAAGAAPVPPWEAADLLRKVQEQYAGLRSYELVGSLTIEGEFTIKASYRVWASYPRARGEFELMAMDLAPGASVVWIADVSSGRMLTQVGEGSWVEEELEQGWGELAMSGAGLAEGTVFTALRAESLAGRPAWVLEGRAGLEGEEARVLMWVDAESLWIRKIRVEAMGGGFAYEVHEFLPGAEVSADRFLLPPEARVVVRPPRSPQAVAIMERVWDEHKGLTSFFVSKTERADRMETAEIVVWYRDPILRVERTSRIRVLGTDVTRIGPTSVTIQDFESGAIYSQFAGQWDGGAGRPVAPGLRSMFVLGQALSLSPGARYTAVEEDVVGDRPAWRITGEPPAVRAEPQALRWWIDRETYQVLQYEETETVIFDGVRRVQQTRTYRIHEFRPGVEAPPEKLALPEGVPLKSLEELRWGAATPPAEPGERAEQGVVWAPFSPERLAEARAAGKPVLLYFTADWCLPCRDLEDGALHDKRVVEAAEPFVRLKVDLTLWDSPESARLRQEYRVSTVPLILILDSQGAKVRRIVGSVPAWVLLDALRAAGGAR